VARSLIWGKSRDSATVQSSVPKFAQGTKKPRTMPGLLSC
jgi:hypothetical protein